MPVSIPPTANLTNAERASFFSAIESSLQVSTQEQFLQWAQTSLQSLFPHEILICGMGRIEPDNVHIHHLLSNHFPLDYLEKIRRPGGGVLSPTMAAWCREQKPQLFEPDKAGVETDNDWLEVFRKFDLRNIAAHGMRDLGSGVATYFSFSRIPGRLTARHAYLLELLVPHLHVALVRALPNIRAGQPEAAAAAALLSEREMEILRWLDEGKTNWEISRIFDTSDNTVKNQVRCILIKLKVNNRAQAVAKARELGLVR